MERSIEPGKIVALHMQGVRDLVFVPPQERTKSDVQTGMNFLTKCGIQSLYPCTRTVGTNTVCGSDKKLEPEEPTVQNQLRTGAGEGYKSLP